MTETIIKISNFSHIFQFCSTLKKYLLKKCPYSRNNCFESMLLKYTLQFNC